MKRPAVWQRAHEMEACLPVNANFVCENVAPFQAVVVWQVSHVWGKADSLCLAAVL